MFGIDLTELDKIIKGTEEKLRVIVELLEEILDELKYKNEKD